MSTVQTFNAKFGEKAAIASFFSDMKRKGINVKNFRISTVGPRIEIRATKYFLA